MLECTNKAVYQITEILPTTLKMNWIYIPLKGELRFRCFKYPRRKPEMTRSDVIDNM
jgi:NAD kinase